MRRAPPPLLLSPLLLLSLLAACGPATSTTQVWPDTQVTLGTPAQPAELRVLVMGDQGIGGDIQVAVAKAMTSVCAAQGCDLGLGMGDNFYPQAPAGTDSPIFRERFADPYGGLKMPFLMAAGNHDESWIRGGDGANPDGLNSELAYANINPQWVMPARFYRAHSGEGETQLAQFFVVDTAPLASYLPNRDPVYRPGGPFDAAQRGWLKTALAGSTARWNIVVGHHPLLNNGLHGSAGSYDFGLIPWGNGEPVRALFQQAACGKADLIAAGHDHTLQLFAASNSVCPGTRLLVSGAAGETTGPGPGRNPSEFQAMDTPGFFWLKLSRTSMTTRAYTVNKAGVPTLAYESVTEKP
ncbi:metallophosphoesterase [Deinococcus radiomollis]|uniref:metallophosphoesterase n=1 Tax=Deinococcus radiomollis TaxID=468916 RepID=UPI0038921190